MCGGTIQTEQRENSDALKVGPRARTTDSHNCGNNEDNEAREGRSKNSEIRDGDSDSPRGLKRRGAFVAFSF